MKKTLLFAATLLATTSTFAQNITWNLGGSDWSNFTKRAKINDLTAEKAAEIKADAAVFGNGFTETQTTTNGLGWELTPKVGTAQTEEEASAANQTLSFSFINNSMTDLYIVKSIEFDVAVANENVELFATLKPFIPDGTGTIATFSNLLPATEWATVVKNGTFQRVKLTLPEDLKTNPFYQATLNLFVAKASTTDKIAVRNVKINIGSPETTAIRSFAVTESVDAKTHNLAGQLVDEHYKGIVVKGGRKYFQK